MESKEKIQKKGKRNISILTIFLWIALIVVMIVITAAGIKKGNALENSRTITLKIDFSMLLNDQGITDPEEIKSNLEGTSEIVYSFKTNNVTSESDILQTTTRYIGLEEETIGIYEIDVPEEAKYVGLMIPTFQIPEYQIVNDSKIPELIYFESHGAIYSQELYEGNSEYSLTVQRIEAVTMKLDVSEIKDFDMSSIGVISNDCFLSSPTLVEKSEEMVVLNIYPISGRNFEILFGNYKALENNQELGLKELFENYYYYKDIKKNEIQSEYQFKLIEMEKVIEIRLNVVGEMTEEYDSLLKGLVLNGVYVDSDVEIPFDRKVGNTYIYQFIRNNPDDKNTWFEVWTELYVDEITVGFFSDEQGGESTNGFSERITLGENYSIIKKQIEFLKDHTDKTYVTNQVKWVDKEKGIAQIDLGHNAYYLIEASINIGNEFLYYNKLSDEFELSPEYELDSEWEIVDSFGSTEDEILSKINEYFVKGKKYLYVKDDNLIYWFEGKVTSSNSISRPINVRYKDYEKLQDKTVLQVNHKSVGLFGRNYYKNVDYYHDMVESFYINDVYHIKTPTLIFNHTKEGIIKIDKEVKNEIGTHTYYVGVFTDNISTKTDRIYNINTVDGKGSTTIEVGQFANHNTYYIYETDVEGNKISDVNYSKNKIEFNDYIRDTKITTDNTVISSMKSDTYAEEEGQDSDRFGWIFISDIEKSVGTGEVDYVDNVLSVNDIYQDNILITSEMIQYKVIYEPEEGGNIEGDKEEIVSPGETPKRVPIPKPDERYEFVRWEIEKNGERVEVNPSEYEIIEDTIFYAIFEKVAVDIDTSDMNFGVYVGISLVAIVGIISIIFFVWKNKRKEKVNS
ncbi:MAG: hypothetical protein Q4D02_08120 [Clostridia bacterium]|nr:hypothetical protein [Clostridia bacterium]